MAKKDNTGAERQRRHRERRKAMGLTQVNVSVPIELVEHFKALAEKSVSDHLTAMMKENRQKARQGTLPLAPKGPAND